MTSLHTKDGGTKILGENKDVIATRHGLLKIVE